jgi:hypothetical protein
MTLAWVTISNNPEMIRAKMWLLGEPKVGDTVTTTTGDVVVEKILKVVVGDTLKSNKGTK